MKKKRQLENKQLCLTLELNTATPMAMNQSVLCAQRLSASVIQFPARKPQRLGFRERVIQDLMSTRVIIAE